MCVFGPGGGGGGGKLKYKDMFVLYLHSYGPSLCPMDQIEPDQNPVKHAEHAFSFRRKDLRYLLLLLREFLLPREIKGV